VKDVIALAIVGGCFALAVRYVGWCDRIIGDDAELVPVPVDEPTSVGTGTRS
jgi:hypothetical protein